MSKIKKSRVNIAIDMTPLVDVAFLLLTFFMLTSVFRPTEDVEVILPMSHSPTKLPESDVMTIAIDKNDSLYLGFAEPAMMERFFGPENRLKKARPVKKADLADLLMKARGQNMNLRTIVRTDANNEFGGVSDVLEVLQKTQISRFSVVTNYETGGGRQ